VKGKKPCARSCAKRNWQLRENRRATKTTRLKAVRAVTDYSLHGESFDDLADVTQKA
jgi:hypothetical protein